MSIRVLLADDQALFREGLDTLLSIHKDIVIVGQASNGQETVDLALKLRPDVISNIYNYGNLVDNSINIKNSNDISLQNNNITTNPKLVFGITTDEGITTSNDIYGDNVFINGMQKPYNVSWSNSLNFSDSFPTINNIPYIILTNVNVSGVKLTGAVRVEHSHASTVSETYNVSIHGTAPVSPPNNFIHRTLFTQSQIMGNVLMPFSMLVPKNETLNISVWV